jgi:hypothetical protein
MKIGRVLLVGVVSTFLLLLAPGPARAGLPSVLDGLFPAASGAFPGMGTCEADGTSGSTMTPFGLYPPPCQIDPNEHFAGNPQFSLVVMQVQGNPIFKTAVPEPGTLLLFSSGLAGLVWMGRRGRPTPLV